MVRKEKIIDLTFPLSVVYVADAPCFRGNSK
jgi:hypothetical protein